MSLCESTGLASPPRKTMEKGCMQPLAVASGAASRDGQKVSARDIMLPIACCLGAVHCASVRDVLSFHGLSIGSLPAEAPKKGGFTGKSPQCAPRIRMHKRWALRLMQLSMQLWPLKLSVVSIWLVHCMVDGFECRLQASACQSSLTQPDHLRS